jgi:phage shock protein C
MEQATKRLTRSRRERVFGGICGGLAAYLGWDVVLVRVAWVGLTVLSGGSGIILYLLAWLIIPLDALTVSTDEAVSRKPPRSDARIVLGVLVVIIGVLALSSSLLPWFWNISRFRIIGPVVLIVLGVVLLLRTSTSRTGEESAAESNPADQAKLTTKTPRRLVRIREGKKIAGVCTGLGHYFNVDPTIFRMFWLVLVLAYGAGVLLYFLFWIAMPLMEHAPEERLT